MQAPSILGSRIQNTTACAEMTTKQHPYQEFQWISVQTHRLRFEHNSLNRNRSKRSQSIWKQILPVFWQYVNNLSAFLGIYLKPLLVSRANYIEKISTDSILTVNTKSDSKSTFLLSGQICIERKFWNKIKIYKKN